MKKLLTCASDDGKKKKKKPGEATKGRASVVKGGETPLPCWRGGRDCEIL